MVRLSKFTEPEIDVGEYIEVLAANTLFGQQYAANTVNVSNNFVRRYSTVNKSDYNELFIRIGSTGIAGDTLIESQSPYVASVLRQNVFIYPIVYANGLFIAYDNKWQYNGNVVTSTDGINWSRYPRPVANKNIYAESITYGQGLYVMVGFSGIIETSTNGQTWTSRTSGSTSQFYSITYGNGLFVACGAAGLLKSSTDGITWDTRTAGTTNYIQKVVYGNGLYVYANFGTSLGTSTDGISWTYATVTSFVNDTVSNIYDITYGNGTYVAVGTKGISGVSGGRSGYIATSTDAVTWTSRSTIYSYIDLVDYTNGVFFIKGFYYYGNDTNDYRTFNQTSTDGITWNNYYSFGVAGPGNIAYGAGKYVFWADEFGFSYANTINNNFLSSHPSMNVQNQFLIPPYLSEKSGEYVYVAPATSGSTSESKNWPDINYYIRAK